jgi:hypothetical protein
MASNPSVHVSSIEGNQVRDIGVPQGNISPGRVASFDRSLLARSLSGKVSQNKDERGDEPSLAFDQSDAQLGKREVIQMTELDVEAELDDLAGDQFDSLDDFIREKSKGPAPYLPVGWYDTKFTQDSKTELDDQPPKMINSDDGFIDLSFYNQNLKFLADFSNAPALKQTATGQTVGAKTCRGYHLIFPAEFVYMTVRKDLVVAGHSESAIYDFDRVKLEDLGTWRYLKAIPLFINYLFSHAFPKSFNDKIDAEIALAIPNEHQRHKGNPLWTALNSRKVIKMPLFTSLDFATFWSLEGVDKYLATKHKKYLHVHLLIFKRTQTSISDARWHAISKLFVSMFGSNVTVQRMMSKNQFFYLGKEKVVVGTTLIYDVQPNELPRNSIYRHNTNYLIDALQYLADHFLTSNHRGEACKFCTEITDDDTIQFCDSWGWDFQIYTHLVAVKNDMLFKAFGGGRKETKPSALMESLETFMKGVDSIQTTSLRRLKVMLEFKAHLLRAYFEAWNCSLQEAEILVDLILRVFNAWLSATEQPHFSFIQVLKIWMRANVVDAAESFWKNVLAVGGLGGLGKSSLMSAVLRGAGFSDQRLAFRPDATIGRDANDPLSMGRFYDDVHRGNTGKGKNIFVNFTHFEDAKSRLFKENLEVKPLEFIVCTSTDLVGFPTYSDYQVLEGVRKATQDSYKEWRSQIERRFTFYTFTSHDDFLLPYLRFLSGRDTYTYMQNNQPKIVSMGTPSWHLYTLFT